MSKAPSTYEFDRSKLALTYDVNRLQQDTLDAIRQLPPHIHYSVIPLTTPGERNTDVTDFSDPDWTTWVETQILTACPYIQEILNSLACRKTNVRLLRLEPGGELKEHTDPQLNLQFRNKVRLHVPIFTSDLVAFILNGTAVPLHPGELWYMRLSDPHSVHNRGQTERIQLSVDVVVNEWIENMIIQDEVP